MMENNAVHTSGVPDQSQSLTPEERAAARQLGKKQRKKAKKEADLLDEGLQQRRKESIDARNSAKLRIERSQLSASATKNPRLRVLPPAPPIPLERTLCAWCRRVGHALSTCDIPDTDGYLPGCPRCNDWCHSYDECENWSLTKNDEYYLSELRDRKCLVRTRIDPREKPKFWVRQFRPHTPRFTAKLMADGYYHRSMTNNEERRDEERPRDPAWGRDPKDICELIPRQFRETEPTASFSMGIPPALVDAPEYHDKRRVRPRAASFNDTIQSQYTDNNQDGRDVQCLRTLSGLHAIAVARGLPTSRVQAILKASQSQDPAWKDSKNIDALVSSHIRNASPMTLVTDLPAAATHPPNALAKAPNKRKLSSSIQYTARVEHSDPHTTLSSYGFQIPGRTPEGQWPHSLEHAYGLYSQGSIAPMEGSWPEGLLPQPAPPQSLPSPTSHAPSTQRPGFQPPSSIPQAATAAKGSLQVHSQLPLHVPKASPVTLAEIEKARAILDRAQILLEASQSPPQPQNHFQSGPESELIRPKYKRRRTRHKLKHKRCNDVKLEEEDVKMSG